MNTRIILILVGILVLAMITVIPATATDIQVINVIDYTTPNDGINDNTGFSSAIAACQAGNIKHLHVSGGTYNLTSMNFPANISVSIDNGSTLSVPNGNTIIFYSPFNAGLYPVFSSTGTFNFGEGAVKEIYPQWWPSDNNDDSVAINKAIESHPGVAGVNVKLIGNFTCYSTINIARYRVRITGCGRYATMINFNPSEATVLFEFDKPEDTAWQCELSNLSIVGGGNNQKIGIRLVNVSAMSICNIAMLSMSGNSSIGLQIRGRELCNIENISISADLPVSIETNPVYSWLSIDHFTFKNTYLITGDDEGAAVKIASNVYLTNVVFEGSNAWCCGKYGLYWNDTTSTGVSANLSIKNVRMEQGAATGGYIVYINHNYALHNLILENIYGCQGGVNGVYLRKCCNVSMQNLFYTSTYSPTPKALDIDGTCADVTLSNCYWNGGTVNTGTLVRTFGTHKSLSNNGRVFETWDRPDSKGLEIYGVKRWSYKGNVANNTQVSLPVVGSGYTNKLAVLTIVASDGSNNIIEGGTFAIGGISGGTVKLISGTSNMSDTSQAGKLCIVSGNTISIINYLGSGIDVVVTINYD